MENTFPQFIIFKKQRWRACINSHAFRIDPNCFALFFIRGYFFLSRRNGLALPLEEHYASQEIRSSPYTHPYTLAHDQFQRLSTLLPFATSKLAGFVWLVIFSISRECTHNHVLTRCLIVSLIQLMILLSQLPFSLSLSHSLFFYLSTTYHGLVDRSNMKMEPHWPLRYHYSCTRRNKLEIGLIIRALNLLCAPRTERLLLYRLIGKMDISALIWRRRFISISKYKLDHLKSRIILATGLFQSSFLLFSIFGS